MNKEVLYTPEQEDVLKKMLQTEKPNKNPLFQSTDLMILDALDEQQNTLQNIENILQRIEEIILLGQQTQ